MRPLAALVPLFALLTALGAVTTNFTRPAAVSLDLKPTSRPQVKLAVLVVFDQMRSDYPTRWRELYGSGGFLRLFSDAAWYTDCHYPYGTTTTGPGHASILTGTCPDRHGIVNNNWNEKGADVYCAGDSRYEIVPRPEPVTDPKTGKAAKPPSGGTPERLLSETVADVLKQTHGPRAKVFGLSLKDRSAVLPTGRQPDGAFWFDGRIVTSTYYTDRIDRPFPEWVKQFQRPNRADKWFGQDWVRFRPDLDYARYSGLDDAPGEGGGVKQGRTFPHPMTGGLNAPGKDFYEAIATSPYGNELLLEVAKKCIISEELGLDDVPDLLVVSFSANDLIGHAWGPDSQEVLDVTLRTDALLADFLRFLDAKVGKGNYVMALTADHGICPLVEASNVKKRETGDHQEVRRVDPVALQVGAEKYLTERFSDVKVSDPKDKKGWIEAFSFPWLYLNPRLVAASGRPREVVASALARYLQTIPDVSRAYTRQDLERTEAGDAIERRVRRSYYPARCGDVYVVLNPFDLPTKPSQTGTTHGSPYDYDTSVPLMVLGPGIPGGPRSEPVTPQATAAIFSRFLGQRPPAHAEYPVPGSLLIP